jgi:hypothetical protein
MRRVLAVSVLCVALFPAALLLAPSEAAACSCIAPPPPVEAAREVDAVFHAKLLSVAPAPTTGPHDLPTNIFTFEVVRTFKGQLDAQVNVRSAESSAACGRNYGTPGSEWLIYARIDDKGQLYDNLCSRTREISEAADDIAELEANADSLDEEPEPEPEPTDPGPAEPEPEPVLPVSEEGPEPAEPGKKGCAIGEGGLGGGLGALLGIGLGLGWIRRRRG